MRFSLLLLSAVAAVSAQNFTSCCSLDPGTVDPNRRLSWCRAQRNTCPEVCPNGQVSSNTCDDQTLTFDCKCSTGNTPNISDYGQTLPSLECDEWKSQCIKAHPNDLNGQTFCLSFTCGSKNATLTGAAANPSSSNSASSGSSPSATVSGGKTASSSSAAQVLRVTREYGTSAVLLGLSGLFAFAL